MSRIHPSNQRQDAAAAAAASTAAARAAVYTVWKRSSIGFQGTDGFSVYDHAGTLAFRVDNYSRRRKLFSGDLLLMDGHGSPLLALTPQSVRRRPRQEDKITTTLLNEKMLSYAKQS
uniref:Uncharacterized protein n=1 Tax=Oryza rufipogon TaxID=4529 RepID=A0A0E0R3I3_ORYRU